MNWGQIEEGSFRKSAWSNIQDGRQPIFKMAAWFLFLLIYMRAIARIDLKLTGCIGVGRGRLLFKISPIRFPRWPPADFQNGCLIFVSSHLKEIRCSKLLQIDMVHWGQIEEGSFQKSAWSNIQDGCQPIFQMAVWFRFRSFKVEPLLGFTWNLHGALEANRGRVLFENWPVLISKMAASWFTRCFAVCVLPSSDWRSHLTVLPFQLYIRFNMLLDRGVLSAARYLF